MSFPEYGKVLFSATLVRGHIAKFHIPYLKWFKEQGWETWVAAKNDYPDGTCEIPYCDHFVNIDFARSPFSKQTMVAYRQLRELFSRERFDLVHTHTPVGGVLTRLAARGSRKLGTKVVYTAHGFHFYDGAPLLNWVLWYPVERFMSRFTDILITINDEDYKRANIFAHCGVAYVPGVGIDLAKFNNGCDCSELRNALGFGPSDKFILAVGDLIKRKNHQSIIRALSFLDDSYELAICGTGVEHDALIQLAQELGLDSRVKFLGFRRDVSQLMKTADVLVFPSIHEGLPVTVMEAMASGLPVIATRIRGICPDLIQDGKNGIVLNADDPRDMAAAIRSLFADPALYLRISSAARNDAERFDLSRRIEDMSALYRKLLSNE